MRFFLLSAVIVISFSFIDGKTDKRIVQLKKSDWNEISEARESLIKGEEKSIEALIALTADTSFQALTEASDIIYPGTKEYTGKGTIVDYDLDYLCVRAGWILEEMSFNDFGYKANAITDALVLDIRKQHPDEIRKAQHIPYDFRKNVQPSAAKFAAAASKVKQWWDAGKNGWTRFGALKEALKSESPRRQTLALLYLRNGQKKIDQLDKTSWENELKPLVLNISKNGKNGPNEEAKLLLNDTELFWLDAKK